jgi:hypothetical protein
MVFAEGVGALPRPDGLLRTQQIAKTYSKALRDYTSAMVQMNRYLLGLPLDSNGRDD